MRGAVGASSAVAVAALLLLAACTGESASPQDGPASATDAASPSATATRSPAAASPAASTSADPDAAGTETPSAASPSAAAASPAAPAAPPASSAPSAAAPPPPPPPQPDKPPPGAAAEQAAAFQSCSQEYLTLTQSISLGPSVTPVVVEAWTERYQQASALAAEGSYSAAIASCRELVAAIASATG